MVNKTIKKFAINNLTKIRFFHLADSNVADSEDPIAPKATPTARPSII